MEICGNVFKYGDNVDTDVIIPARYLNTADANELAKHCMEDIDATFVSKGPASGCGHYASGFGEYLEVAEFKRLNPDALGCRNHDAANVRIDLAPLEDFGGDAQVGEPSVGAASDHDLIDRYVPDLIYGTGVFWKVRECDGWTEGR